MGTESIAAGADVAPGPAEPAGSGAAGTTACRYHTVQPAPTQWVAIGVARVTGEDGTPRPRLLVEVGQSEEEAVAALRCRCR